ncbi:hypothetical protein ACFS5L_43320 [Streptomyces phyllanthi]|uniref:hypothetical protein n=1 Tax=Streptomyces phyllanthi TaxID=1803180 RepID=UPI001D159818|nr:hypothetical protein [Streptomyces phyllanthi]
MIKQVKQVQQIKQVLQVAHERGGDAYGGPAALGLALAVAYELHPPVPRAPEVAAAPAEARARARRNTTARIHRRTVRG